MGYAASPLGESGLAGNRIAGGRDFTLNAE